MDIQRTKTFFKDYIEHMHSSEHVKDIIEGEIMSLEQHEMHEWLKFDGKNYKDPHPELDDNQKGYII